MIKNSWLLLGLCVCSRMRDAKTPKPEPHRPALRFSPRPPRLSSAARAEAEPERKGHLCATSDRFRPSRRKPKAKPVSTIRQQNPRHQPRGVHRHGPLPMRSARTLKPELSVRRAEAIRPIWVEGIDPNRIYTEGKARSRPCRRKVQELPERRKQEAGGGLAPDRRARSRSLERPAVNP